MEAALVFAVAAAALLGSPGPGIAALLAVGRARGLFGGIGYLATMQIGLAIAAGLSAAGLVGILQALPWLRHLLTIVSALYLLWLAWQVVTAPLGGEIGGAGEEARFPLWGAFTLGIANPKAYLAFASLFGSFVVVPPAGGIADAMAKWLLCVAVMAVVDFAWLLAGAWLGRITLAPKAERRMNVGMGLSIVAACALALT